jgi:hypothetical protein
MKIGALSLFNRTSSAQHISVASWHSSHSLTWRWGLHASLLKPWPLAALAAWRNPGKHYGHGGLSLGVRPLLWLVASRDNNGWQFMLTVLCVQLDFHQQRPMWYRDLYRRQRDRELETDFASQRPPPIPVIEHPTLQ